MNNIYNLQVILISKYLWNIIIKSQRISVLGSCIGYLFVEAVYFAPDI